MRYFSLNRVASCSSLKSTSRLGGGFVVFKSSKGGPELVRWPSST